MNPKWNTGITALFEDPITLEVMEDAVITACGHSFSKKSLNNWLQDHETCPVCLTLITQDDVTPNYSMREVIGKFKTQLHASGPRITNKLSRHFSQTDEPPAPILPFPLFAVGENMENRLDDDYRQDIGDTRQDIKPENEHENEHGNRNENPKAKEIETQPQQPFGIGVCLLSFCSTCLLCCLWLLFIGLIFFFFLPEDLNTFDEYSIPTFSSDPHSLTPFDTNFTSFNILLDGHTHTRRSRDGVMGSAQLVDWALGSGFNAIIVSDHNEVRGAIDVQDYVSENGLADRLVVIPAQEYSCCRVHLNFVNIQQRIRTCGEADCANPTDEQIQAAIQQAHDQGGWVVVNHFPWSNRFTNFRNIPNLPNHPTLLQLFSWGADAVEVTSERELDLESLRVARNMGKGIVTGSNVHIPGQAFAWTILNSTMDANAIVAVLQSQQNSSESPVSFLYNASGTPYPNAETPGLSHENQFLLPYVNLGDFLGGFFLYDPGVDSFVGTNNYCHDPIFSLFGLGVFYLLFHTFLFFSCALAFFYLFVYLILALLVAIKATAQVPTNEIALSDF